MLKRQRGQAFILVLILLMVGALVITPALNLAFTGLKGRMAEHTDLMEYYAADGASDYSLWRLAYESGFAASLPTDGTPAGPFYIILNGIKAEYSVSAKAAESAPSGAPITSNKYKVTASVTPTTLPLPGSSTTFTYTITLKLMYPPPPDDPVTQLKVTVPSRFSYLDGSNTGFLLLDTNGPSRTGPVTGYSYTWDFGSGVSFNYWEEKTVTFRATTPTGGYPAEGTYYLKVNVTPSVPAGLTWSLAPVVVGNPSETGLNRIKVTKTVFPTVIPPGVPTLLTYTLSLKNESTVNSIAIQSVQDALPAGFSYSGNDTGFFLLDTSPVRPDITLVAGGTRQQLEWTFTPTGTFTINAGQTVTATFQAIGTVADSGSYYNEVWVDASGATQDDYSWPTGGVTVPQYDIESSAGDTTLKVNAQISGGSHVIKSWQVE